MDGGERSSLRGPDVPTPARVSLAHIASPSPRRLSSGFAEPRRPARRKIAWISLQGHLVGAEEATSAAAIGGGLVSEEAVAWELFSPLQRVLVVAAVAAAAKRSQKIAQLQRSVEIRDDLLLRMQEKFDNLLEEMNSLPDQVGRCISGVPIDKYQIGTDSKMAEGACKFCCSRNPLQELNPESGIVPLCKNMSTELPEGKDIKEESQIPKEELFNVGQTVTIDQEERRMSDLSDFNWSVASTLDFQLSTLATEQELYNLRKELEEKDVKIKELTDATNAVTAAESKRITELEEIIRRKNLVISKLKKDMTVLEKQVIELTRLRRGSSAGSSASNALYNAASCSDSCHPPVLTTNILYDMSSTSPSSSDPDSPVTTKRSVARDISQHLDTRSLENKTHPLVKHSIPLSKSTDDPSKQRSVSPLKENRKSHISTPTSALRQKTSEDYKRNKSTAPHKANYISASRRWT